MGGVCFERTKYNNNLIKIYILCKCLIFDFITTVGTTFYLFYHNYVLSIKDTPLKGVSLTTVCK